MWDTFSPLGRGGCQVNLKDRRVIRPYSVREKEPHHVDSRKSHLQNHLHRLEVRARCEYVVEKYHTCWGRVCQRFVNFEIDGAGIG